MQLKRYECIRNTVTAATAALLGSSPHASAADLGKLESSMLLYSEADRVKIAEGVIDFTKPGERRSLGLRLTLDGLTGASPNGAAPASHVQTFTRPSGGTAYTVPAAQVPLETGFNDLRAAGDGTMIEKLDRLTALNFGAHLSIERDYNSLGASAGISRDFNSKNTTLAISGSYSHDTVLPIGGVPVPLSSMPQPAGERSAALNEDDDEHGGANSQRGKDVMDAVFGVTQVLDRETLLRLDYSFSRNSGYLTDPYKLLSVVQDWGAVAPGDPTDYLFENRPTVRNKQALFGDLRRYIAGTILDVSYRYFWDSWGVRAHAVDSFYQLSLGGSRALEPHLRWYRQSEADFYNAYLVQGQPLPPYASADSRLAAFDAVTAGLKYSFALRNLDRIGVSAEYYTQLGSRGPPEAIGVLSQYDLFPRLDVLMFRVGFTHGL